VLFTTLITWAIGILLGDPAARHNTAEFDFYLDEKDEESKFSSKWLSFTYPF
jgi:hypothetical protein